MRGASVLCGNIKICAHNLRNVLKKGEYALYYDEKTNKAELRTTGFILLEISNIPHESALKLAEDLGLTNDSKDPTYWTKWNPHLHLEHNGSVEADLLWF